MAENDRLRRGDEGVAEAPLITLTEAEYAALQARMSSGDIRIHRRRRQWDFVFNVGLDGVVFQDTKLGHTPQADRIDLRTADLPILGRIAATAVATRREAGRFFGDTSGIYYKARETGAAPIQCVRFAFPTPAR